MCLRIVLIVSNLEYFLEEICMEVDHSHKCPRVIMTIITKQNH